MLKGQAIGISKNLTDRTMHDILAANVSWLGPVNTADGMISPKIKTTLTDSKHAIQGETILSKNRGKASLAVAFARRSVTSK
mmetsp:Transcript_90272/g.179627  ORF Transcript_90272/g.179627 Transcript_90272/m.179627 type:complete len:82 (+) Transcript_90272:1085-1330(+)